MTRFTAPNHPIRRAAVFGATGGIGGAICRSLLARPELETLHHGARVPMHIDDSRAHPFTFDLSNEASIAAAADTMAVDLAPLDFVFIATGILHDGTGQGPEKSYRSIEADHMAAVFEVNLFGPALIAKHVLPLLPRRERSVFAALSARVGSITDNRLGGWHSYRASKAALNMMIRNFALEMATRAPQAIIVGLHPGTVDSGLSAPFQRNVAPGKLFSPDQSAGYLLDVLDRLSPEDSGGLFGWDGELIPY